MKIAIMQPYFMPYIGYFQLINAVDKFIIYDDIQFTKKGWINRNRILVNGNDALISLPIKKDSDYLSVKDRFLSDTWDKEGPKLLARLKGAYSKAPYFKEVFPLLERCVLFDNDNLFEYIFNSLKEVTSYLEIDTPFVVSSSLDFDNDLRGEDKVLDICRAAGATQYINPIGGVELYDKECFADKGVELSFLKTGDVVYPQFKNDFVPFLSIIDVMMFNSMEDIAMHSSKTFELI